MQRKCAKCMFKQIERIYVIGVTLISLPNQFKVFNQACSTISFSELLLKRICYGMIQIVTVTPTELSVSLSSCRCKM